MTESQILKFEFSLALLIKYPKYQMKAIYKTQERSLISYIKDTHICKAYKRLLVFYIKDTLS